MVPRIDYDRTSEVLREALRVLGESSRPILMEYVMKRYGVSIDRAEQCSDKEIEMILRSILGRGAEIITDRMQRQEEFPE
ncbi:MAG: hypothetical protein ACREBU_03590 [Nitrososphaera sp.]